MRLITIISIIFLIFSGISEIEAKRSGVSHLRYNVKRQPYNKPTR